MDLDLELRPIGYVESALLDRDQAPKQGDEGAPPAWIVLSPETADGGSDLKPGDDLLVLTWLHQARRDELQVHPRGDLANPLTGVFSTRSPDRPNPIGLHRVRVQAVDRFRFEVTGLEAIDGTPVLDLKPVLGAVDER